MDDYVKPPQIIVMASKLKKNINVAKITILLNQKSFSH